MIRHAQKQSNYSTKNSWLSSFYLANCGQQSGGKIKKKNSCVPDLPKTGLLTRDSNTQLDDLLSVGDNLHMPAGFKDNDVTKLLDLPDDQFFFQGDGATPHHALLVRVYFDETFPNRYIERRGSIEWPARSPDLTSLDYFL